PNAPPDIVATQGTVEQWTIQNRAGENHEFHFHQVHFLVKSQDHFETNGSQPSPAVNGQYLAMIQVPSWDGNPAHPYPSVTALVDFRGPDVGDFVFHCHILGHEDLGMMNIIRVQNPTAANRTKPNAEASAVALEVADRVVEPAAPAGKPANHHHH